MVLGLEFFKEAFAEREGKGDFFRLTAFNNVKEIFPVCQAFLRV
jgi:hypothetical protein